MADTSPTQSHSPMNGRHGISISWIAYLAFLAVAGFLFRSLYRDTRHAWSNESSASAAPTTQASLKDGERLFLQNCAICHGTKGDGNGIAANVLDPKPRDFHVGKYRLVTSANGLPFRSDVIHTIRHGMAGTSMPAWLFLKDIEVESLADYVMSISRESLKETLRVKLFAKSKLKPDALEKKLNQATDTRLVAEDAVQPGEEPAFTTADIAKARATFLQACAVCHGTDAKGMQNPEWRTEEGLPIASRNLRSGVFKGGGRGRDIYTRIYAGIPGTPMPSFSSLGHDEIWRLAHFVEALAVPDGQEPEVLSISVGTPATQPSAQATIHSLEAR